MSTSSSLSLALADIEILRSAYPDETSQRLQQAAESDKPSSSDQTCLPLYLTLHLNDQAFIELEFVEGYPFETNIRVSKYRADRQNHKRLEESVAAVRKTAEECLEAGMEGGISCCAAAFDAWQNAESLTDLPASKSDVVDAPLEHPVVLQRTFHWISGDPLVDKKSTFIAHVCRVTSDDDVRIALAELIDGSTKIQRASHNMYAYRFTKPNPSGCNPIVQHDNDDDGEDAAGSRLAHLLEMRKEDGVLVVVSRWFGGTLLGPKRFAHITNVAREILDTFRHMRESGGSPRK